MKFSQWFKQSNRPKHLFGGFLIGLFSLSWFNALYSALVAGSCLELKDKLQGNKWDWVDLLFTLAGGVFAALLQVAITLVADPMFTLFVILAGIIILLAFISPTVYRFIRFKLCKIGSTYKSPWKDDSSIAIIVGKNKQEVNYIIRKDQKDSEITTDSWNKFFETW